MMLGVVMFVFMVLAMLVAAGSFYWWLLTLYERHVIRKHYQAQNDVKVLRPKEGVVLR